jgi:hypothetical protein
MKQSTRDNLTYLALGLTVTALVVCDAFYSDYYNRKICMPSGLAFNAAAFMGVLVYRVVRETQKAKATIFQTFACVYGMPFTRWNCPHLSPDSCKTFWRWPLDLYRPGTVPGRAFDGASRPIHEDNLSENRPGRP